MDWSKVPSRGEGLFKLFKIELVLKFSILKSSLSADRSASCTASVRTEWKKIGCTNLSIVVGLMVGVRVAFVQGMSFAGQRFLDVQSQSQGIQFVQFENAFLHTFAGSNFASGEIVFAAALVDVLDQMDGLSPGVVRQSTELLLKSWTVLDVGSKVGGQQQVVEWLDDVVVGIGLEIIDVLGESRVAGVAVDQIVCFCVCF